MRVLLVLLLLLRLIRHLLLLVRMGAPKRLGPPLGYSLLILVLFLLRTKRTRSSGLIPPTRISSSQYGLPLLGCIRCINSLLRTRPPIARGRSSTRAGFRGRDGRSRRTGRGDGRSRRLIGVVFRAIRSRLDILRLIVLPFLSIGRCRPWWTLRIPSTSTARARVLAYEIMRRDGRDRRSVDPTTNLILFSIMRRLGRMIRNGRFVLDQRRSRTSRCFPISSCESSFSCVLEKEETPRTVHQHQAPFLMHGRRRDSPPFHAQIYGDTKTKYLRRSRRPLHPLRSHRRSGLSRTTNQIVISLRFWIC